MIRFPKMYFYFTFLVMCFGTSVLATPTLVDATAPLLHHVTTAPSSTLYKRHVYENTDALNPFKGNIKFTNQYSSPVVGGVTTEIKMYQSSTALTEVFSTTPYGTGTAVSTLSAIGSAVQFTANLDATPLNSGTYLIIEEKIFLTSQCDFSSNSTLEWDNEIPSALPTYINQLNIPFSATLTDYVYHIKLSPSVTPLGTTTVCYDEFLDVIATGANTYVWSPMTDITDRSPMVPSAFNQVRITPTSATTTYTITGTDGLGCSNTITFTINSNPSISLTSSPDDVLCGSGNTYNLSASASGGMGSFSYTWSPAATLSSSSIANPVATPIGTTTYQVIATDAAGCTAVSHTMLTVNPIPEFTLMPTSVCLGSGQSISAIQDAVHSGDITYTWQGSPGYTSPSLVPTTVGTYTVFATLNGCTSSVHTFQVANKPTVVLNTPNSYTLCSGSTETIQITFTGTPPFVYTVTHADGSSSTNTTMLFTENIPFTATTPDVITITQVHDANGDAETSLPISVNVPPISTSFIVPMSSSICSGVSGSLNVPIYFTGIPPFFFDFAGTSYTCSTYSMVISIPYPSSSTTYSVSNLRDRFAANTCIGISSGTFSVNVLTGPCTTPPPCTTFCGSIELTSSDQTLCVGNSATLTVTNTGSSSLTGSLKGSDGSSIPYSLLGGSSMNVSVSPTSSVTYYVEVDPMPGCDCILISPAAPITLFNNPTADMYVTPTYECAVWGNDNAIVTVGGVLPPDNTATHQYPLDFSSPLLTANALVNPFNLAYMPPSTIFPTFTYTLQSETEAFTGCVNNTLISRDIELIPESRFILSSPDITICEGETTTLTIDVINEPTDPYTIYLSDGTQVNGTPGGAPYNVTVSPTTTTTYRITTSSLHKCNFRYNGEEVVTVNPKPIISGTDLDACEGKYTVHLSGADYYEVINLNDSIGFSCTDSWTMNYTTTTTFQVIGYSADGCPSDPITVTVNINHRPATPGSIVTTIEGINTRLTTTAGSPDTDWFDWDVTNLMEIISGLGTSEIVVKKGAEGNFFATVYAMNECGASTCFAAAYIHTPFVRCYNDSFSLALNYFPYLHNASSVTSTPAIPGMTFTGGILVIPSFPTATTAVVYHFTYKVDSVACGPLVFNFDVTVNPRPTVLNITASSLCAPSWLTSSAPDPGCTYSWIPPSPLFIVNNAPIYATIPGSYALMHINSTTGCYITSTIQVHTPVFNPGITSIALCNGTPYTMNMAVSGLPSGTVISYQWKRAGSTAIMSTSSSYTIPSTQTTINYTCTVTTPCGTSTFTYVMTRITSNTILYNAVNAHKLSLATPIVTPSTTLCPSVATLPNTYGVFIYNVAVSPTSNQLLTVQWGLPSTALNEATISNNLGGMTGLTFQWQRLSGGVWNPIVGETNSTLVYKPATMGLTGGLIRCRITAACTSVYTTYTNAAMIIMHPTITYAASCKPTINWVANPTISGAGTGVNSKYQATINSVTSPILAKTVSLWALGSSASGTISSYYSMKTDPAIANFTNTAFINSCTIYSNCSAKEIPIESNLLSTPQFTLSPNPVNDRFTISYGDQQNKLIRIKLLDIQGNVLYSDQGTLEFINLHLPSLSHWSSGIYLVHLIDEETGAAFSAKLVKE